MIPNLLFFLGTYPFNDRTIVHSGHLGISLKCPDYQGVQVRLHVNGYFGTITECPDYGIVPIFKCPD